MKIYGKTLADIFREMSWQQKIIVVAGAAFILFSLIYVPQVIARLGSRDSVPGPVSIKGGKGITGFLDPSLASDGSKVFMAFTAVTPGSKEPVLETRVASAIPPCNNWTVGPTPFRAREEDLMGPNGTTPVASGAWRAETPALVYDPSDKGQEWKIFAYKYFWSGQPSLARLYGMIVYSHATDPTGEWSTEEWIMSASESAPPYPYAPLIRTHINDLSPELADVYFYGRPSVVQSEGVLLMSLSAFVRGKDTVDRVVLLVSDDHGKSWQYLGAPLKDSDLAAIGPYKTLGGASLLMHDGAIYLAAVAGDDRQDGLGTLILGFDSLRPAARLSREQKTGAPAVVQKIPLSSTVPTRTGGGYAAYADTCAKNGVLASEYSGLVNGFRIFRTYQRPVDSTK